ncbi:hypothetical protein Acr_27g0006790 [Actinidia rufa]|uniref:Uncharacterized protein n=1 Tax=Actinidia rufa TaxID=165716 RepID=A0A7J0H763_9ERIC|nr:hypothetical protein Acr_27g0006790 [Actinidia rufa]
MALAWTTTLSTDLPSITALPVSQVSEQTVDPIVGLAEAIVGVDLDSSEAPFSDKCNGEELMEGTSRRFKRRVGATILGAPVVIWKPEFSACKLGRQVTLANSAKDHDTSMALVRDVLLPNDVPALNKESLKTIQRAIVFSNRMKEQSTKLKRAKKKDALAFEFPESYVPYSPLNLPYFDELEYVNWTEEDEDVVDAIVAPGNDAVNLEEEAPRIDAEGSGKEDTKEAGEDTTQDPPLEL